MFLIWKITKLKLYAEKRRVFYTVGKKINNVDLISAFTRFWVSFHPPTKTMFQYISVFQIAHLFALLWLLLWLLIKHYIFMQCFLPKAYHSALFISLCNYYYFFKKLLKHNCKVNCIHHFCKDSSCAFCRCCHEVSATWQFFSADAIFSIWLKLQWKI